MGETEELYSCVTEDHYASPSKVRACERPRAFSWTGMDQVSGNRPYWRYAKLLLSSNRLGWRSATLKLSGYVNVTT